MAKVAKSLAKLISQSKKKKTGPYDTQATVKRVEGNTVWVSIPGGVDETPINKTVNCSAGDKVQVRVSGGRAWITGNASAPPTDDATAVKAQTTANEAKTVADSAQADASRAAVAADSAEASAETAKTNAQTAITNAGLAQTAASKAKAQAQNASEYASRALGNLSTVQSVSETLTWITQHGTMTLTSDTALDPTHVYFVVDPNGDYTVGSTKYSVVTEPDVADISTYYELSIDESLNNYVGTHLALTQEGLWLLPASSGTNKVLIATGAGSTYTTAGTYILNSSGGVEASFRANGATIGQILNGYSRTEIGTDGMRIYKRVSGTDTQIANLGFGDTFISNGTTVNTGPYNTLGIRRTTTTAYNSSSTYSAGDVCLYDGHIWVCNTDITTPEAWTKSHWDYYIGGYSTVFGYDGIASGAHSLTSGRSYSANINGVDVYVPLASIGLRSSAIGYGSIALADDSHAFGIGTKAQAQGQTVIGKWNVPQGNPVSADNTDKAFIIGSGQDSTSRSNALTVDWRGNVDASGNINIASGKSYKINGTNLSASDVSALPISGGTMTSNGQIINGHITNSSSRETTPNLTPTGTRGITALLASSAMTTARPGEGTIIHCEWDNNGGWNSQLFVADNDSGNGKPFVAVRGQRSGTWTSWDRLLALSDVADYVTSKGTSGNWYYQKWNSGLVEAIFKGSVSYTSMSASGQLYRSTNNAVAIPSGIFTTTPQRTEVTINNASTVVVCATAVATSTTNVNVQVWRSTNSASSIDMTIRCVYTP